MRLSSQNGANFPSFLVEAPQDEHPTALRRVSDTNKFRQTAQSIATLSTFLSPTKRTDLRGSCITDSVRSSRVDGPNAVQQRSSVTAEAVSPSIIKIPEIPVCVEMPQPASPKKQAKESSPELLANMKRFIRNFKFFESLQLVVQERLPEILEYEKVLADKVLYRQGDTPDFCYIVLSGRVSLLRKQSDQTLHVPDNRRESAARRHSNALASMLAKELEDGNRPLFENAREEVASPDCLGADMAEGSFVDAGMIFGDSGFWETLPRSDTAVTKEPCELLVISRSDIDEIIQQEAKRAQVRQHARLTRQLLKEIDFFSHMSSETQEALQHQMHHVHMPKGVVLFREGEPPDRFYIVLSGEVGVWKKNPSGTKMQSKKQSTTLGSEVAQQTCTTIARRLSLLEDMTAPSGVQNENHSNADSESDLSGSEYFEEEGAGEEAFNLCLEIGRHGTWGELQNCLGPGVLFGEVGLLNDQMRNSTATCNEDCDFLTLERPDFNTILKDERKKERAKRLPAHLPPLLEQIPFFAALSPVVKRSVPFIMNFHTEKAGSVLFWEGDPPGRCYFLLAGEVSIWTTAVEVRHNFSGKREAGSQSLQNKCAKLMSLMDPGLGDYQNDEGGMQGLFTCGLGSEIHEGRSLRSDSVAGLMVARLGPGCIFGETALLDSKPRSATIRCEKDSHFLLIEKSDFDNVLRDEMLKAKVKALSPQLVRLLREFPVFQQLDSHTQESLCDIVHFSKVKRSSVLFEQGANPNHCYIILSGEVTVWKRGLTPEIKKARQSIAPRAKPKRTARQEKRPSSGLQPNSAGSSKRPSGAACPDGGDASVDSPEVDRFFRAMPTLPPLAPVNPNTLSQCTTLALMLREAAAGDTRWTSSAVDGGTCFEDFGTPVVSLGPGKMFGEMGRLADHKRDATVTCREDCEFLVIHGDDFDRILKAALKKANKEKMDFLKTHVPIMRGLPEAISEAVLRCIEKVGVPRHHHFVKRDVPPDGSVCFVWNGAVEAYEKIATQTPRQRQTTPRKEELVNYGILLTGSVFGAVAGKNTMPYSVVAASSPCEVLRFSAESLRQLPEFLAQGLRDFTEQAMWRRKERRPLSGPPSNLFMKSTPISMRQSTTCALPSTKAFMHLRGDLQGTLHLGKTRQMGTGLCRRIAPPMSHRAPFVENVDRRSWLRSPDEGRERDYTRSMSYSQAESRPGSRSRSQSRSLSPTRSVSSWLDSGSRCNSRSNLRAMFAPERPFVDVTEHGNGNLSEAGKHPMLT